ncbi:MAG: Uma2 family endonuclease [Nostocales cyanobacterium]|nr:MAG: Uma2 family endonuclease [Nostocales cyanobacterium]TAF16410.1 MAG: Uma2 family endonuclease [Nostocales cyanobacterium]
MTISKSSPTLPFLENGDRLDRAEFERRYTATPNVKKAELIEGIVHVASPLRFTPHAKPHGNIVTWLGVYKSYTSNIEMGVEPTVRLDNDNEPQPDVVLFRVGGNAQVDDDGYITGAPELIVEIAASTVSYDVHDKKRVYQRNGVKEYIVWRTFDQEIDWFVLADSKYVDNKPDAEGIIKSVEFPGLWLNVRALLGGDMQQVLRTLNEGISQTNLS